MFHGWKIYDYLVYIRFRFLQREARWKGLEDTLDECIDEEMRSLDQMCFSSQYYMMMTVAVNGIVYFVLGVQMMVRQKYNGLGDPALLVMLPFFMGVFYLLSLILVRFSLFFNLWGIKHDDTAWTKALEDEDDFDIPDMDDLANGANAAYFMHHRITSETFRYKFLDYNRPWLIEKLPELLTPQIMRRSKPFLLNQFSRVLSQLDEELSSDSDGDDEAGVDFGPVNLSYKSKSILKWWLGRARRLARLRSAIQLLINKAKGTHCEQCLSVKQLQVQLGVPIMELAERFLGPLSASGDGEPDLVAWKRFWIQNQSYTTICLKCKMADSSSNNNFTNKQNEFLKVGQVESGGGAPHDQQSSVEYGPVHLTAVTEAIIHKWYKKAQMNIWGTGGQRRPQRSVEGEWAMRPLQISESSHALAIHWLRAARYNMHQRIFNRIIEDDSSKKMRRSPPPDAGG